jgi:hypothetical protein
MEQTECSETSAHKIQTPGNYPEENIQHILILFKHLLALQVADNTGGSQERMNMCIKYPTYKHYYCCNLVVNKSVSERVRHCPNKWIIPLRFFQVFSYIRVVFSLVIKSTMVSCLSLTKELITYINIHQR